MRVQEKGKGAEKIRWANERWAAVSPSKENKKLFWYEVNNEENRTDGTTMRTVDRKQ